MFADCFLCLTLRRDFLAELDAELESLMYKSVAQGDTTVLWCCSQCHKKVKKKSHMRMHVETHLVGLKHKCDHCLADFKTRSSLKSHIWKFHNQNNIDQNVHNLLQ